jgi:hypothetical protein
VSVEIINQRHECRRRRHEQMTNFFPVPLALAFVQRAVISADGTKMFFPRSVFRKLAFTFAPLRVSSRETELMAWLCNGNFSRGDGKNRLGEPSVELSMVNGTRASIFLDPQLGFKFALYSFCHPRLFFIVSHARKNFFVRTSHRISGACVLKNEEMDLVSPNWNDARSATLHEFHIRRRNVAVIQARVFIFERVQQLLGYDANNWLIIYLRRCENVSCRDERATVDYADAKQRNEQRQIQF